MKKPHVLNRSMFNRGGTSAYGRGITSNLVTEEQRQKFNYGGRVRANMGFYSGKEFNPIERTAPDWNWNFPRASELFGYEDRINRPDWMVKREKQQELMGLEDPEDYQAGDYSDILQKKTVVEDNDGTQEVMTDSDWMDLLGPTEEQKRRTKGEAQLGLAAGALDVFSQPTIAKGMKAASPHLSKLSQTATADQKARDKAILQGKVLSKVYSDRAKAKGEADIATAEAKAGLLETGDTPRAHYHALKSKQGMKKAMGEALNYQIQVVKKDDDKNPIIPEGIEDGTVMWLEGEGFIIIQKGKPVFVKDVDLQIFGLEK